MLTELVLVAFTTPTEGPEIAPRTKGASMKGTMLYVPDGRLPLWRVTSPQMAWVDASSMTSETERI